MASFHFNPLRVEIFLKPSVYSYPSVYLTIALGCFFLFLSVQVLFFFGVPMQKGGFSNEWPQPQGEGIGWQITKNFIKCFVADAYQRFRWPLVHLLLFSTDQ